MQRNPEPYYLSSLTARRSSVPASGTLRDGPSDSPFVRLHPQAVQLYRGARGRCRREVHFLPGGGYTVKNRTMQYGKAGEV